MALGAAGLLVSTAGLEWYLVSQKALLIDTTYSGISLLLILGQQFWLNFREQSLLRQQIKKQFEHYLDPRQVKRLQDDPDILKLGGEKKEATFLFTDVRGFTSMSEKLEPEQVTYVMNKALTAQQEAVQKHGGMVDKYIGDAMMAIFNAPLDIPSHAKAACDCAHDIVKNMKELNNELQVEGLPPIAIGIGVNTGEAVIGNMGSESRFDYTAIGDAVNCGARLESATKEAGKDILIGERTESLCGYYLQELDPMPVKGKAKPLRVFTFME
jgi:adenylate cyclase